MTATRTQVYFIVEQSRRLDERASAQGKTLAEVVREAVDRHVGDPLSDADRERELDLVYGSCPDFGDLLFSRDERDRARD